MRDAIRRDKDCLHTKVKGPLDVPSYVIPNHDGFMGQDFESVQAPLKYLGVGLCLAHKV